MFHRITQFLHRHLPVTISKKHIGIFLILSAFVGVVLFGLSTQSVSAIDSFNVRDGILEFFTRLSILLARLAMAFAIFFLRFFIQLAAYNGYLDAPIVRLGWVMLRDIGNMFFVVALLVIAFATILGRESYEWKKAMVKLVLVAIVVNFSLLICGLVLDAAHVFTVTFVNAIAPVAAGNLIEMFNFNEMERIITDTGTEGSPDIKLALLGGAALAFGFSVMAAIAIGAYCVVLLARMVSIWALLIFSPLAFILSVLPATENYFEEWKSEFIKNVLSAPIAVFFLWLAFATMSANGGIVKHLDDHSSGNTIGNISQDSTGAGDQVVQVAQDNAVVNSVSLNVASTWANMAGFLVAFAFLLKGIQQVQSLGVAGAGWLDSASGFAKTAVLIGSGVWLGGKMLQKGLDVGSNTAKNIGMSLGTKTGILQGMKTSRLGTILSKGAFYAEAKRAEGRMSAIEGYKEKKDAMYIAEGKRGVAQWFGGGQKSLNKLAEQTALTKIQEGRAQAAENMAMANADIAAQRTSEFNTMKGEELRAETREHAAHEGDKELTIRLKQDAYDGALGHDLKHELEHAKEHEAEVALREKTLSDTEKLQAARAKRAADESSLGVDSRKIALSAGLSEEEASAYEKEQANNFLKAERLRQEIEFDKRLKDTIDPKKKYTPAQLRQKYKDAAMGLSLYQTEWQKLLEAESTDDAKAAREGIAGKYETDLTLSEEKEYEKIVAEASEFLLKQRRTALAAARHGGATYGSLSATDQQTIDEEALKSITEAERAKEIAQRVTDVGRGMVRYASERYVAEQGKAIGKAKKTKETMAALAKDLVKREEGKISFEADALLRAQSEEYIKDFAHMSFEQRIALNEQLYGVIKRYRANPTSVEFTSDEGKKMLANTVQDMRKLQASIQADFSDSQAAIYLALEKGTTTENLNSSENLQLINLAAASGYTLDELKADPENIRKAEKFIKEQTKDKYNAMQRAQQISMDRGALAKHNVEAYGAFQEAYDDSGVRRIVMSRQIQKGPLVSGGYSSGTDENGSDIRKRNAESNIAKSLSARKVTAMRSVIELDNVGGSARMRGVSAGMKELYMSVAKNIVSTQLPPTDIRFALGDSYDGTVLNEADKGAFVFAGKEARDTVRDFIAEKVRTISAKDITPALRKQQLDDLKDMLKAVFGKAYRNDVAGITDDIDIKSASPEQLNLIMNTWLNRAYLHDGSPNPGGIEIKIENNISSTGKGGGTGSAGSGRPVSSDYGDEMIDDYEGNGVS